MHWEAYQLLVIFEKNDTFTGFQSIDLYLTNVNFEELYLEKSMLKPHSYSLHRGPLNIFRIFSVDEKPCFRGLPHPSLLLINKNNNYYQTKSLFINSSNNAGERHPHFF